MKKLRDTSLILCLRQEIRGSLELDKLKDLIGYGASPRATINLAMAARGMALLRRRGYVVPDDVRSIAGCFTPQNCSELRS